MYHCITVSRNCQAILNVTMSMCFLISSVMTHLPFSATKTQDSAIHWPSMSASKTSNEEISKTPDLVSCKSNSCQDTTKRTRLNMLSRSHCPDFLGYLKKLHLVSVCSGDLPSTQEACAFASELKMRTFAINCDISGNPKRFLFEVLVPPLHASIGHTLRCEDDGCRRLRSQ